MLKTVTHVTHRRTSSLFILYKQVWWVIDFGGFDYNCFRRDKQLSKMASDLLVLENFIDGKFVPCDCHIDSYDPSTGEVYCKVPDSDNEEVDEAVKAAKKAFDRLVRFDESILIQDDLWMEPIYDRSSCSYDGLMGLNFPATPYFFCAVLY